MEMTQDIAPAADPRIAEVFAIARDTLRRRWLTLALVALAVMVAGTAFVMTLPPKYAATTRVRIDPSRNPLATRSADGRAELTTEAIETEVSAIRALPVALEVVQKLSLDNDPEFAGALKDAGAAARTSTAARQTAVANAVLGHLDVSREKLTYLIDVKFTSSSGQKSATIADAFASTYIDRRLSGKASTAERQSEWFSRRLAELAVETREADQRVAEFRGANGITESSSSNSSNGTVLDQQVAPLASSLSLAESDAAGARSALSAAQAQMQRGGIGSVAAVLSSEVVSQLRAQRALVVQNMAEVQARYGDRHPETLRVREQLAGIDAQIQAEARRVVSSLQANAAAAGARADSLKSSLSNIETQRARDARNSVLAESLEREAAAKRAQYDRMSQLSLDSMQAARVSLAPAEIVDNAEPPAGPTSPNRPLLLVLTLIVALAAGTVTIAVQEALSGGLTSVEDIEREYGLPVVAAVPKVGKAENPADLMLDEPTSFYAEALRIGRAAVMGVRAGSAPQVVALTSALPAEGKSTTALAFARTLAIAGSKTILVECDVRRAVMQNMTRSARPTAGIVEVLHGDATVDEAIMAGDVPNLDVLLQPTRFFSSENLFGEHAMDALMRDLRGRYEHIVLDLPPLLGLADGRFLAILADATIVVVKWNDTSRGAVSSAINFLRTDGSRPVGIMLSMVDPASASAGALNYYSNKYSDYYQNYRS